MENKTNNCPRSLDYETIYLKNELRTVMLQDPSHHLYTCPACQKYIAELDGMYTSILSESNYPISNKLLDFACKVSPYKSSKGLFSCSTVGLRDRDDQKTFKTHKLFIQHDSEELVNFDAFAKQMSRCQLAMRVITDPAIDCLLVFFWSKQQIQFSKWSLSIPGIIDDYTISSSGTVIIPAVEMHEIQNRKLCFRKKVLTTKTKVVNKIQDCILV